MNKNIIDVFSTTTLQSGMLLYDLMHPGSTIYMQQYIFNVTGDISLPRFIRAWMRAFKTFPAMRTSFHWEGLSKPLQVVHKHVRYPFVCEDLRTIPAEVQQKRLEEFAAQDRLAGFRMGRPPLVRLALFRLKNDSLQMFLTLHHIITDGWSLGLLFSQFCGEYAAQRQPVPDSPETAPSMKRYVEYLQTKDSAEARLWWQERLQGAEPTPLPPSTAEGSAAGEGSGVFREELRLDVRETRELANAAKGMGITLNILFQAAWAQTLAARTNRPDVLFASCAVSRPPELPGIETVYGPLLDIIPIRAVFEDMPVRQWLHGMRDTMLSAMSHGHMPLTELRKLCADGGEGEFLTSMTVFENFPYQQGPDLPFSITPLSAFERTSYALTILGYPEEAMRLAIIYDAARFGREDTREMLASMRDAMLRMARSPEQSVRSLLCSSQYEQPPALSILQGETRTNPPLDPWRHFNSLVLERKEQTALIIAGARQKKTQTLSYSGLMRRSLDIAAMLHAYSFGPGDLVGVRLETGPDAVATMLAAWRLGGAWAPLPPAYPQHLAEKIQAAAELRAVVTTTGHWSDSPTADGNAKTITPPALIDLNVESVPQVELPAYIDAPADSTACVIYTSGSTGTPKGVSISHGTLTNRLHWMWEAIPWREGERAFAKTTMAFVDFIWELFGGLLAGVPVVVPDREIATDTAALFEAVQEHRITRLILTPSVLASAQRMGLVREHCRALSVLTCSGESLPMDLTQTVFREAPGVRLLNLYGSTELMGDAAWFEIKPEMPQGEGRKNAPIGVPIANTQVAVIDANGMPVPRGREGELAVTGACLASGYHKDKALTESAFVPLPEAGKEAGRLWFKTGDIAFIDDMGILHCLGRKDRQIKIRGVRVEPSEVTACLKEHPAVRDAVVCAMADNNGKKRLAAYVIPQRDATRESALHENERRRSTLAATLENHVKERLIAPKQPEAYMFLDAWPVTVSGKIDMLRLPSPFPAGGCSEDLPVGETENLLADIWQQILEVKRVGREDDFFRLGGNSLLITQLAFMLRKALGRYIPFQNLYQVPRLKDMAAYLASPETIEQQDANPFFLNLPREEMIEEDVHTADAFAPQSRRTPLPLRSGMRVLLTGAPGFISLWLLAKLLDNGTYSVLCLEEHDSTGTAPGRDILRNRLMKAGCWKDSYENLLSTVPGRLGQKLFGLSEPAWNKLAASVDMVFHCGLHVNLAQSYQHLRPVNIGGTKEVIRFCCEGKTKPLHYISSHAIIDSSASCVNEAPLPEDAELTSYQGLPGGYTLSRWVMERMIWLARQRGLPAAIYRYVPVGGDTATHQCETSEIYWRLLRLFCRTGTIPESGRPVNIIPVDAAASLVLTIATDEFCYGRVFHICNPRSEPWSIWSEYLHKLGYSVSVMSGEEWFRFFTNMPEHEHDDNSRVLLSFFGRLSDKPLKYPEVVMDNTRLIMEKYGLAIQPLSFDLFKKYWAAMRMAGWLPGPEMRSTTPAVAAIEQDLPS